MSGLSLAARLHAEVSALLRNVAADIVLPRYQALAAHEIEEKEPGELVTAADRESEDRLTVGLSSLEPSAKVIGEEACAADAQLLSTVGQGLQWIIDPIDGTGNYAAGRPPFGIMVALADGADALAGWMLDPLTGRLCHARVGEGAFLNDQPLRAVATGAIKPVAALATGFMTAEERETLTQKASGHLTIVPIPRCAAEQYPRLTLGENDISVFRRTLPWDHAAGALFLNEAGGRVRRTDGSAYRLGDRRTGLLAASSPALWDRAAQIFYG